MALFVHLAPEKDSDSIRRSGIKTRCVRNVARDGYDRIVFAMPVTNDFYVSHQWLRELKRSGPRTNVGVYFRIPDDQLVLVGHYNQAHSEMTANEAVGTVFNADEPEGFEVIIPRKIEANEIHKINSLAQAIAWCDPLVDVESPTACLRSSQLRATFSEIEIDGGYWQTLDIVNRLVGIRASQVDSVPTMNMFTGRLVCCDVSASEASGGSRVYSDDYFDDFDVPPWDTWVAWFQDRDAVQPDNGYLIAWVPPSFCELAQRGIDASPAQCVFWADNPAESAWSLCRFRESVPSWYLNYFTADGRRT